MKFKLVLLGLAVALGSTLAVAYLTFSVVVWFLRQTSGR